MPMETTETEIATCDLCLKALNPDNDDEGEGCECAAEEERDGELRKAWADYESARSQYHHLKFGITRFGD